MRKFLCVLAGLTCLTACGQNGALYLPEDAKPPTNAEAAAPEQSGNSREPEATSSNTSSDK